MSFADLVKEVDATCLETFGLESSGVSIVFTPQDGSGPQTINGIVRNPAMEEDFIPGSVQGTAVLRLFVRFAEISPSPQQGDVITVNSIDYVLETPEVDLEGGSVLKLRAL